MQNEKFRLAIDSNFQHDAFDVSPYGFFRETKFQSDGAWTAPAENTANNPRLHPTQAKRESNALGTGLLIELRNVDESKIWIGISRD
jgi:hypothetical protein